MKPFIFILLSLLFIIYNVLILDKSKKPPHVRCRTFVFLNLQRQVWGQFRQFHFKSSGAGGQNENEWFVYFKITIYRNSTLSKTEMLAYLEPQLNVKKGFPLGYSFLLQLPSVKFRKQNAIRSNDIALGLQCRKSKGIFVTSRLLFLWGLSDFRLFS